MPVPLSTATGVESAITNIVPSSVTANSSQGGESVAPNESVAPASNLGSFSGNLTNNTPAVAPAVAAPHPDSTTSTAPVAPASTNRSVTLPNGQVVQIDSKGNIVSGNPAGSPAANAYAATQTDTGANADAAKVAASQGISTGAEPTASYDTDQGNQILTAAQAKALGLTPSSGTPFIATSDSIIQQENDLNTTLQGLNANNPAEVQAQQDYLTTLQNEADALEQRRTAEDASINSEFDAEQSAEEGTQANETGVLNISVRRAGGYLGMGASQTGALLALNKSHALTMQSLEAKRQDALQTANSAIDDKEFTLAETKAKEAQDYLTQQNQEKQQYLQDQISINKAQQDNVTYAQDQAQKSLTALATLTPDQVKNVDPATLKNIDQVYGVPGFAAAYISTTNAINTAKSQDDAIAAQKNMLDLLQAIPKGQQITFPDPANPSGPGVTYTGLGSSGDVSTFTETDDNGNVTLYTYDKGSNTVTRQSVGATGKTKTTGAGDTDSSLAPTTTALQSLAVPLDPANPGSPKFVTAAQYVNLYQAYVAKNPGKGAAFMTQFPVEETVVPSQAKNINQALKDSVTQS